MEAGSLIPRGGSLLRGSPSARRADPIFRWALTILAALVLVLLLFFFVFLIDKAHPAISRFGVFGFTFGKTWAPNSDPALAHYGALPLLIGTIVTSLTALIIGVPIAIASALYITELCPRRLRTPLTILVELLAAVPSVVYGLWGFLFLSGKLRGFQQFLSDKLSFIPFIGGATNGHVAGPSFFIAGVILAIMILPIVSAISREVITTVPSDLKEAVLALGGTRWEMIRTAVLPYSRAGITGAAMLGLGRAIGETIAVTLVIGSNTNLPHHLFDQGDSLAAVIASEFGEAADDKLHTGALIAAGLVLFVLTLVINGFARYFVIRGERTRAAPRVTEPGAPPPGSAATAVAGAS